MRNADVPAGNGGGGTMLQLTVGSASTGPAVVCENVVATPYDQSHAVIVPGADDVLPLNVQASVVPPSTSEQVSDSVVPLTPKLAVATPGGVTARTADRDTPPYAPEIVVDVALLTSRVPRAKVAAVAPAATVTFAATLNGSVVDNTTTAPPEGAAEVSAAVPVTVVPPITEAALRTIDDSAAAAVTVNVAD
jgi:hypothetical protein